MLTKNINEMKAEIAKHIKADAVIQGSYWDEDSGKGCFIGCLSHAQYAGVVSDKYGIPLAIVHLLEGIFEALPEKDSVKFFKDVGDSIGVNNKDLSLIHYLFLRDTLKRLPVITENTQDVIFGLDLLAEGKDWPEQKVVRSAAWAAYYAAAKAASYAWAEAAARSAARAAWAAYYAASAACYSAAAAARFTADAAVVARAADASVDRKQERKLQAQLIIQLLKDAPIMESE